VIARTLGIVDVAKASTSDKMPAHKQVPPAIHVNPPESSSLTVSEVDSRDTPIHTDILSNHDTKCQHRDGHPQENSFHLQQFFAAEDKLSGVGVFSPATSLPPSPPLSRRNLQSETKGVENVLDDILTTRKRVGRAIEESGNLIE
jgi:hypothetical protein